MTEQHIPGQQSGEASAMPELSTKRMPEKAVNLVNESLQTAFPQDFGITIPALIAADINVVKDGSFQVHQKQELRRVSHSLVNKWTDDITSFLGINLDDVPLPPLGTSAELPGRPIMYSESAISSTAIDPLANHLMARLLAHEHIHRLTKLTTKPTNPSDPLFNHAFHIDRTASEVASDEIERNILALRYKSLYDFASINPSEITVEGAQVVLKSKDTDGTMRRITQSGYDLNEALVEYLLNDVLEALARDVQKNLSTEDVEIFNTVVFSPKNTAGSFRYNNYIEQIKSAIDSSGIDKREILHAYINGDIPRIFGSNNPKQQYFT